MKKTIIGFILGALLGVGVGVLLPLPNPFLKHQAKDEPKDKHEGHGHGPEKHDDEKKDEGLVELSDSARKAAGIRVASVEKQKLGMVITATGVVRPNADQLAHVSPKVVGRIIEIKALQGSQVKEGAPLLTLDSIEMAEAAADYLKAKSTIDVAELNFKMEEELIKTKATRGADFYEAKGQYLRAQAEARASREKLLLLGWPSDKVDSFTWGEQSGLSRVTVFAPVEGEVTEKHATLGEVVKPETNLYTIANLSTVWVELSLYPKDLRVVHKDQPVETQSEAFPGKVFKGKVSYVGRFLSEETRTLKVRVELDNKDGLLRPGLYVTANIRDDQDEHAKERLAIPSGAIQQVENVPVVFVAKAPGIYERRAVTLGQRFGDLQEIIAGVEENETIVTEGAFILKSELLRAQMGHDHAH